MAYAYDIDNLLTGFETTGGPTFTLSSVTVDGLGRLRAASETLAYPGGARTHDLEYAYDMRSQLTRASIGNINGGPWVYDYHLNFRDKFDIPLEMRLSGVVEQEDTRLYGKSRFEVRCQLKK